jgi:osmotically-inducible protein OsmY
VRRVASEVQGPDKLTDHEIWAQNDKQTAAETGKGSTVSDLWITSATKIRLLGDSRTPSGDINVDTTDGVVTLFGMVGSKDAKRAAEEDARKVGGVRQVKNELQVVPKKEQQTVKARDQDVVRDVKAALAARDDLHDTHIGVEVKGGIARLTGTVPSQDQRITAAVTARSALGVRSVEDDLTVGPLVN